MELKELLESIDIVEYISQFVDLEERNGEFWGLSCFKDEKTPSFSVRRETGSFYCFASGIAGNAYTFTRYYYHCSPREAIEILKKYAGVEGEIQNPREKLSATKVCKKFAPPKKTQKEPKTTILPDNYMERYEKLPEKLAVWEREGISRASLDRFQVCYDGFSDRLVYPIRDVNGKIVNIGGRTLDPEWKKKKLRKYTYFHAWGSINTIYGLSENMQSIKEKGEIILFEGCKSVLIADTWGIHNTGAILTSHLSQNQMKILAKLGCKVVFALDKDVNVREDHNIKRLKQYVKVEYLWDWEDLLHEKDSPVDEGQDVFERLYKQRVRFK